MFDILITDEAGMQLTGLMNDKGLSKRYKAVKKVLQFLAQNPRHPGLRIHEFTTLKGPKSEKVFEAYAEQATPAAYRIFWYYGPKENQITVVAITPHP